jgi:hypothetical protein
METLINVLQKLKKEKKLISSINEMADICMRHFKEMLNALEDCPQKIQDLSPEDAGVNPALYSEEDDLQAEVEDRKWGAKNMHAELLRMIGKSGLQVNCVVKLGRDYFFAWKVPADPFSWSHDRDQAQALKKVLPENYILEEDSREVKYGRDDFEESVTYLIRSTISLYKLLFTRVDEETRELIRQGIGQGRFNKIFRD